MALRPVYACNEGTDYYVARHGFRETLMVRDGVDEYGDPAYRPATVDEEHSIWLAEQREIAA